MEIILFNEGCNTSPIGPLTLKHAKFGWIPGKLGRLTPHLPRTYPAAADNDFANHPSLEFLQCSGGRLRIIKEDLHGE